MGYPVTFFEVLGQDGAVLADFYSKAFGWAVSEPSATMDYRELYTEAGEGIQGGVGKAPNGPGWVTFYITVPDVPAMLEQIESLGGKTVVKPFTTARDDLTVAYFADPEGHIIGIWSKPA